MPSLRAHTGFLASLILPLSGAIQYVAHHAGRQSATRAARHHPPGGPGGHGSDLTTTAKCSGWRAKHTHICKEHQQRCKPITKPHPIPGGSRIQGQITVPSPPVNHWCREQNGARRSQRQGNSRAQRHDQRAHRHDQGASGLHSTSQEDFRQRRCSGANTAGSTATHVCGSSGQGEILLSAKVTGKQPVQCLYGSQNTICCQSTWQAKRCGYASATNAWSSCGGSTNLASLCPTTIATLERSREQTTWPSGAESQQTTSRMESLRETRHLPKGAHARGHSRLMCGTRRHGLHVPSSGRTHGCHHQRAKYSRSQKGNCRGRTSPHETHARRSGCSGLLANPGNPNHAGRVGPLRGSAQAHSRSATLCSGKGPQWNKTRNWTIRNQTRRSMPQ